MWLNTKKDSVRTVGGKQPNTIWSSMARYAIISLSVSQELLAAIFLKAGHLQEQTLSILERKDSQR